jgi:hypothetical protein
VGEVRFHVSEARFYVGKARFNTGGAHFYMRELRSNTARPRLHSEATSPERPHLRGPSPPPHERSPALREGPLLRGRSPLLRERGYFFVRAGF